MTPHRDERPSTSFPWRSALAVALAVSLLVGLPAFTDDTNLLRFDTAKPYVFIILDTSASMGMEFDDKSDVWTPGGADGPGSRLYQAKQALFNTFAEVNDVHFGFASFNQDEVRAYQKHWLYYFEEDIQGDNGWPIPFPVRDLDTTNDPDATDETADDGDDSALTQLIAVPPVDANGDVIVKYDSDGNEIEPDKDTRQLEIEGHVLTFGRSFEMDSHGLGVDRNAGTCDSSNGNPGPLNFNDEADLRKLQSFAIDGGSSPPTQMWLTDGLNNNYLLEVWRPGVKTASDGTTSANKEIGQDDMLVKLRLSSYSSCTSASEAADGLVLENQNLQMRLDPYLGETFFVDSTEGTISDGSNNQGIETVPEMWEHQDAVSEADFGDRPFTGRGWESNYDSGGTVVDNQTLQDELDANQADRWCASGFLTSGSCPLDVFLSEVKPVEDTIFDTQDRRSLDIGDMIPFHWSESLNRRADFLDRLAPGYSSVSEPDFRGASYFADASGVLSDDEKTLYGNLGLPLQLTNPSNRPLLALDNSPLARAINDMRCWYLGNRGKGANKCDSENPVVDTGWEEAACEFDSQFGCRKPYLIIISDGEDNVSGENASADVGDMQGSSGVRTWVLNLGDPKNCTTGELGSIIQAAGQGKGATGECIDVEKGGNLRQELESILGKIRTEVRAFASAAVPTVQATVEQKIFLTNFTPFNDSGTWDGHIDSFLKPLPVDPGTGKPDESKVCGETYTAVLPDGSTEQRVRVTRCFLWDAGDNLYNLQYDDTLETENLVSESDRDVRRVFYAEQTPLPGEWANNRHLLDQPNVIGEPDGSLIDEEADTENDEIRRDLWEAFGLGSAVSDEADYRDRAQVADEVIDFVLGEKSGTELNSATGTETVIDFLLGDIFHSTPQVVGTPPNLFYFARDLNGEDGGDCLAGSDANENSGYRCFFNRHRLRRKMLLVGSNDGQLHAFDAGRFRGHDDSNAKDHFTGLALVDDDANPFGSFDNGTGLELFSYVPRMVMPVLNQQRTTPSQHFFTVDGNFTVADVFIDPVAQSSSTFPLDTDREWRTVVVGGLREGGAGYYALDITQPDVIEAHDDLGFVPEVQSPALNDPATANYIPGCLPENVTDCGATAFPSVVWEFTDRVHDGTSWFFVDEDEDWMKDPKSPHSGPVGSNDPSFGKADLGDSWSTANIGRIQVCTGSDCAPDGADVEDRYVAVFGGGMDVESKLDPTNEVRGNWLYMVDIETGQAIYKQRLTGAAPAEPASVDLNGDGYIDRIYIGTLAGILYRVDVGLVSGNVPALTAVDVTGIDDPDNPSATTFETTIDRIPRDVWVPTALFNANFDIGFNDDGTPVADNNGDLVDQDSANFRPIYYRPAVIFQADNEGFVLAFGTGDREDLWSLEPVTGRFFMLVDSFASTSDISAPLNESDLARVGSGDASNAGQNFLETGGWYLVLNEKERVITEAFSLSGLTIFSAYEPIVFTGEDSTSDEDATTEEEQVCGEDIDAVDADTVCSLRGNSNIYVVNTTNADGLLFDTDGNAQRSKQVADFVTNPFTEQGTVKRADGDGSDSEGDDGGSADELTPDLEKVMESLKELFPDQCRFANYRVDVKTIAADTSLQFIAPIPVCIIEHNWKEY